MNVADPGGAASNLLTEFGSLGEVMAADFIAVRECAGDRVAGAMACAAALIQQLLEEPLYGRPLLASDVELLRFLQHNIGQAPNECLIVLFLDSGRRLISHERIAEGSISGVDIDARRIILKALARGAHGLILAHNHPSGNARPSRSDFHITRRLADLAGRFDIVVHDHLVVAGASASSAA